MDNYYRKRPAVIQAMQWLPSNTDEAHKVRNWLNESDPRPKWTTAGYGAKCVIILEPLGSAMAVTPGCWIVREGSGKFYPCTPDIFERTYELIGNNYGR